METTSLPPAPFSIPILPLASSHSSLHLQSQHSFILFVVISTLTPATFVIASLQTNLLSRSTFLLFFLPAPSHCSPCSLYQTFYLSCCLQHDTTCQVRAGRGWGNRKGGRSRSRKCERERENMERWRVVGSIADLLLQTIHAHIQTKMGSMQGQNVIIILKYL